MFGYYLKIAWVSIRKTPLLSLLIVLTVAVGIAASMTTYTVQYMMSKDPLPGLSDRTFQIQLNSWGPEKPYGYEGDEERTTRHITLQDAKNLLAAKQAPLQTAIGEFVEFVYSEDQSFSDGIGTGIRTVTIDFFAMMRAPFLYGTAWSAEDDEAGTDVTIISKKLNDKLFGGVNSIGKSIVIGERQYRIVGVMDDWPMLPKFYGAPFEAYQPTRDVFVPFFNQIRHELLTRSELAFNCWTAPADDSIRAFFNSECVWIMFWVQLDTPSDRKRYLDFIFDYAKDQRQFGRFQRDGFHKMYSVEEFLLNEEVVSKDTRIGVWLAFLFLIVCLLNCMSLMTAKFHSKAAEVGLRRAVGASKQNLFAQFSCEILLLALFASVLGMLMTLAGLHFTKSAYSYLSAELMTMDVNMVLATLGLAIVATMAFGLLPIIKAIQVQPASQLKSQ
ncbi:ABC transporter permease [Pseudoalteromonas xiamenensis]